MQDHVNFQIEDYLAGQLDAISARKFRYHVAGCRSCSKSLRDQEQAAGYIKALRPVGLPPQPGPQFYAKVQASIEKRLGSKWYGNIVMVLQGPKVVFPLIILFVGLLLSAWTMMPTSDWDTEGIMGIPPRRFSQTISSPSGRDTVMISLVDEVGGR